ncbi:uncharacterized protein DNG_04133 [Cephalotrichum gorgonifer]|uniref:Uncharacterized protein n=1 Tax=Cephalotrichum gorgonifer TaxID=2041049 RepID=A0AAE8MVH1_9PEZI|nr:uncharacterized protein DNG_04133 [Cephalotrichum gorgonifer]
MPGTIPASVRAQLRLLDLKPSTSTTTSASTPSQTTGLRTPGTTLELPTLIASGRPIGNLLGLPFVTIEDLEQMENNHYWDRDRGRYRGMLRWRKWKGKGREGDEDLEQRVPGLEWIRKALKEIRGGMPSLSEVGKKVVARRRRTWESFKG